MRPLPSALQLELAEREDTDPLTPTPALGAPTPER